MGTTGTAAVGTSGNHFGKRLKDLRDARDWSQEQLARETNVSQVTIWNLETGRTQPRLDTIRKLAAALGVDVGDLFKSSAA
jgi:transcriptional regulator with XRE-family HTH domain